MIKSTLDPGPDVLVPSHASNFNLFNIQTRFSYIFHNEINTLDNGAFFFLIFYMLKINIWNILKNLFKFCLDNDNIYVIYLFIYIL